MPSTTDPLFTRFSPRGGSDSNDSAAFSPGTSPPLILAFLAIGLFALSMVVMCGWRRIRYARVVLRGEAMPETEWTTEERNKALGPRPVLWDLQTIDEKGWYLHGRSPKNFDQTEEYETWYTIMPVSVVMTSQPGLNCGETVAPPPNRHRYWWSRRSGPACTNEKDDSRTNDNDNVERQLQITDIGRVSRPAVPAPPPTLF
ncbi:hypothetical protein C0991_011081 [Blastosporella zonata]|nr:hypothetical protein C0991_011081 [Blastosporella zonata]